MSNLPDGQQTTFLWLVVSATALMMVGMVVGDVFDLSIRQYFGVLCVVVGNVLMAIALVKYADWDRRRPGQGP